MFPMADDETLACLLKVKRFYSENKILTTMSARVNIYLVYCLWSLKHYRKKFSNKDEFFLLEVDELFLNIYLKMCKMPATTLYKNNLCRFFFVCLMAMNNYIHADSYRLYFIYTFCTLLFRTCTCFIAYFIFVIFIFQRFFLFVHMTKL